jgi:hypothetical protein
MFRDPESITRYSYGEIIEVEYRGADGKNVYQIGRCFDIVGVIPRSHVQENRRGDLRRMEHPEPPYLCLCTQMDELRDPKDQIDIRLDDIEKVIVLGDISLI